MKIVSLSELLKLPAGTLFQEYGNQVFGSLSVLEGPGENRVATDYYCEDFSFPSFIGATTTMERYCLLKTMEDFGKSALVTFGKEISSNGLTQRHQLFAVYERRDVEQRLAHLVTQLRRGYGVVSEELIEAGCSN